MDQPRLIETLGFVAGGGFSIVDIQMVQWGRELVFEVVYRTAPRNAPPDDPIHFNLIFRDCREIRYKVYAHISLQEQGKISTEADIAELILGKGQHRRDANILTNHFGVTLSYGEALVEYNDRQIKL